MKCGHHLWADVTAVTCQREAGHAGGHVYHGSSVDDGKHDDTSTQEAS